MSPWMAASSYGIRLLFNSGGSAPRMTSIKEAETGQIILTSEDPSLVWKILRQTYFLHYTDEKGSPGPEED